MRRNHLKKFHNIKLSQWGVFLTLLMFTFICAIGATTAAHAKKTTGNPKYASIVMDADTGVILHQRYADKTLHPASLTKMMTLLLAFEAIDRGDVRKTTSIRISNRAASMVPSKLGLPAGSRIKVEDAIYALVTKSANDVAVALAEHLGGSEPKFAAMMTNRARTIGMSKTRFRNASGLHDSQQVSSARDMAKLGRYILQRYPHYYRYFSTKSFTYKGKTYNNHNRLMSSYRGMDGFKTGYINASGFNLVASANRDGRRLIGVVFGGRTSRSRNDHMAEIMDYGFKKASKTRIAVVKEPPLPPKKPQSSGGVEQMAQAARAIAPATIATAPLSRDQKQEAFASLSALNTANPKIVAQKEVSNTITPNYTALTEALENGAFGELIGEGDFDPAVSKRLETGLIAVAVHKGDYIPNPNPASATEQKLRDVSHAMISRMGQEKTGNIKQIQPTNTTPNLPHPRDMVGMWSVQIGAFNSRVATDDALHLAKKKLPKKLSKANPIVVPLQTQYGVIFRARLAGLSEQEALKACQYLKDCMPISPMSTKISTTNLKNK